MKEYKYIINGNEYTVNIENIEGNQANVKVNGKAYDVEIVGKEIKSVAPAAKPAAPAAPAAKPAAAPQPAAVATGEGTPFKAPLPGTIVDIKVAAGQQVAVGDVVLVLEAMKMENEITAEKAGTITSIAVNKGDTVMEGTTLFTIA